MSSLFFAISRPFNLVPILQRKPFIFQTVFLIRYCVFTVACPNIQGYAALINQANRLSAEFGNLIQRQQHRDKLKLICAAPTLHLHDLRRIHSGKMASLDSVADVDIDPSGKFKYILIEIEKAGKKKTIVRGYKWAGYHADIYDQVCSELEPQSFTCECLGGGRIEHNKNDQALNVFGYSMGFGRANHETTVEKLKAWYPSYQKITWSNEGY